jgi:hypothetical protein
MEADLQQNTAALKQARKSWQVKANVNRLWIHQFPRIGIIGPGFQVRSGIGELRLKEIYNGGYLAGSFQAFCLLGCIHSRLLPVKNLQCF